MRLLNRRQLGGARAQPPLQAVLPRPCLLLTRAAAGANDPTPRPTAAAPPSPPKPLAGPSQAPAAAAFAAATAAAAPPSAAPEPLAGPPQAPAAAAPATSAPTPHWQSALDEIARKRETGRLVVVQVAPAVRVAIDEALGKPPGSVSTGQLVAALRALGFDFVFDTLFGADLTVVEEGAELLERLAGHLLAAKSAREAEAAGAAAAAAAAVPPPPMPMFTSCCPGWVAMVEKSNPELIPYLSSCKSPQMMMGAVIKNYFAAAAGKSPDEIVSVSLMPCIRKQGEADRPWFATAAGGGGDAAARDVDRPSFAAKGLARDVDHVITTVELARILRDKGVDPEALSESEFDAPLGEGSGGAQLFGTTGGVMEAALRTVAERVTGEAMPGLVYAGVRGLEGVREATVSLQPGKGTPFYELLMPPAPPAGAARGDGAPAPDAPPPPPPPPPLQIRVAVANGLGNAKKLVKAMADGAARYDFVEVMACPGGCIGGGGQPRSADRLVGQRRQAAIYALDEKKAIRRPHDNALVKRLYADFLGGKAGSRKAHELLHTHYVKGGPEEGGGGGGGGGAD